MAEPGRQEQDLIFALDIGTRSIVGIVGKIEDGRLKVAAIETAEHGKRVMMDGQIDNIDEVAALARAVTGRLEKQLSVKLERVCVAAAGRALRTQRGSFSMALPGESSIRPGTIGQLEAGAVTAAEQQLQSENGEGHSQFFLVGYTVSQYRLDNYPMRTLLHHKGEEAAVDVVATFLPGEVVESLYTAMRAAGLQVASMTLEPIAAMNAAIPGDIRLLNLAMVDIGAGTSDIAVCRDGSIVGYTMVTVAGDEITEAIMRAYLVDFQTAETMKRALEDDAEIAYVNILGIPETTTASALQAAIDEPAGRLAADIAKQVSELNGGAPSALFLAGGGSKLAGLRERVAQCLGMDPQRVAVAGNNFQKSAFSDHLDLANPEYATPLGIAVSAGMGLLNDSYVVRLNGQPAKLFRSGVLTLRDILMMNGYSYNDMIGRTGKALSVTLDGRRLQFRGEASVPAVLRINGEDATIHDLVHAGDSIDFVPARSGADAARTLGELLGADFRGAALVNNREAGLGTPLRAGDVILTLDGPAPAAPAAEPAPAPEADAEPETVRPAPPPPPPAPPKAEPAPEPPRGKAVSILLNSRPLRLPGKADGSGYYMMDLLEYSGIDFKNLDRRVRMEINGAECGFQEAVHQGDSVDIYCV